MAGIAIPTAALLLVVALFTIVHQVRPGPLPIDRVLVFPMAIAPNLWGVWNMLYVAVRQRREWPLAWHGAVLALLAASTAWGIAGAVGLPGATLARAFTALPFVVVMYYLLWKYGVRWLNELLGVA
jgi:hypothetical protein